VFLKMFLCSVFVTLKARVSKDIQRNKITFVGGIIT